MDTGYVIRCDTQERIDLSQFDGFDALIKHTEEMLRIRKTMVSMRQDNNVTASIFNRDLYHLYELPEDFNRWVYKLNYGASAHRNIPVISEMGACISTIPNIVKVNTKENIDKYLDLDLFRDGSAKMLLAGGAVHSGILGDEINDYDYFPVMSQVNMKNRNLYDKKGFMRVGPLTDYMNTLFDSYLTKMKEHNTNVSYLGKVRKSALSITRSIKVDSIDDADSWLTIQMIKRLHLTIAEVIFGFDIPACQLAYHKGKIYATGAAIACIVNRIIISEVSASSTNYDDRLKKYFERGYSVLPFGLLHYNPPDTSVIAEQYMILGEVYECLADTGNIPDQYKDIISENDLELYEEKINQYLEDRKMGVDDELPPSYKYLLISFMMKYFRNFETLSCYDSLWINTNSLIKNKGVRSADEYDIDLIYYEPGNILKSSPVNLSPDLFMLRGCCRDNGLRNENNAYANDQAAWVGPRGEVVTQNSRSTKR